MAVSYKTIVKNTKLGKFMGEPDEKDTDEVL